MFIYETTNLINGRKYIGLCTRDDDNYIGSGKLLKRAVKKYGKENFERKTLATADSFDELLQLEEYYIKKFNAVDSEEYYNLVEGGKAGNKELLSKYWSAMSDEERKTARKWNGHFMNNKFDGYDDPTWRENVSKGVKKAWDACTNEERKARGKKVSEKRKELGLAAGKNNPMYGRSAVTEKNLKWYTNGVDNVYVTEGTEPAGYHRGRTNKWQRKNVEV